jgi:hypothetical protein
VFGLSIVLTVAAVIFALSRRTAPLGVLALVMAVAAQPKE